MLISARILMVANTKPAPSYHDEATIVMMMAIFVGDDVLDDDDAIGVMAFMMTTMLATR